eukprot:CAMPEP_0179443246 /NCGR_PEP_ID=MMETSP0799-20121207/26659_1 /TAXON_ID=46947 /ORGANISM="Geminigera cryophila, Strain CCMP2564" /LENGTH=84 /DNA_ID=CAMNT_0021229031 /DNA_START=782 /DNA_END=1032 /DNA_ORIENTATION=-
MGGVRGLFSETSTKEPCNDCSADLMSGLFECSRTAGFPVKEGKEVAGIALGTCAASRTVAFRDSGCPNRLLFADTPPPPPPPPP